MSAIVGVIMIFLEKFPKASEVKNGESLSVWRALIIGLAQTIALIPGTSRSGATDTAGRLSGLSPKEAAEYSFPRHYQLCRGVTAKVFLHDHVYLFQNLGTLFIANLVAFLSGLFGSKLFDAIFITSQFGGVRMVPSHPRCFVIGVILLQ